MPGEDHVARAEAAASTKRLPQEQVALEFTPYCLGYTTGFPAMSWSGVEFVEVKL